MKRVDELRAKYIQKVRGELATAKYILASKRLGPVVVAVKEAPFAGPGDVVGESELGLNIGFERWCE